MSAALLLGLIVFLSVAGLWLHRQARFELSEVSERPLERTADGSVQTVYFHSGGERIEAWLYQPEQPAELVVIMAPGLTSTKDCLLEPFAWTFVRARAAVLLFDFRTLGGSEGQPRHWLDPFRQMADYDAALEFARQRFERVVLWGSSFSGGQALCLAAKHPEAVHAVIAHAPYLAASPELEPKGWRLASFIALTVLDLALATVFRGRLPPVYVAAFGKPGEFVFAPSDECPSKHARDPGAAGPFWRALPEHIRGGWRNVLCARMLASLDEFVPMKCLDTIRCPVLLVGGRSDGWVPAALLQSAAAELGNAQLHLLACAHFDLYVAPILEQNLAIQSQFLRSLLCHAHGQRASSDE